jgi:microcystin degradation protein MlrC
MSRDQPRLAVLGLWHETNTFCLQGTDLAAFEREGILRGEAIWDAHASAHTTLAGFWRAGRRLGAELVPLVHASAVPSGMVARDAFEMLAAEMIRQLRALGPWDGVLLAQHGAAVAEGCPDVDGELVERVRAVVGPGVPIGLALDLHANVSARMVEGSTVTVIYRTNPHVDPDLRGEECAELIVRTVRGEVRPVQALCQVPVAIDITRHATAESPMRELLASLDEVLARPGILSASIAEGYPWSDVPEMGMSCLVVSDGDPALARSAAGSLAREMWSRRGDMLTLAMPPDEALLAAAARAPGPSLVLDVGDNIGGGAPGDSTVLLEAAIRLGIQGVLVVLVDPNAVAACEAAGVGGTVGLAVGGRLDPRFCAPVEVVGRVLALSDGRYEDASPTHGGQRFFDAGPTAAIATTDEHTIVLTSRAVLPSSLEQLRSLGLRPEDHPVLTAKGVVSPRAAYEQVTRASFVADTAGVTAAQLTGLPYRFRRRPLFPFELGFDAWPEGRERT